MTVAESTPRWRRLEPDARREQILACAIRLFGERPFAAVSTTEIADEAGVARGLINHYFGTKRDLYLEVVRTIVAFPDTPVAPLSGPLERRIEASVDWFLDFVGPHGKTWLAVIGPEGIGDDPEVDRILADADRTAAERVLSALGIEVTGERGERAVAAIRVYGGLVKAAGRAWIVHGHLTREQVHRLLSSTLVAIVRDVLPDL